MIIGMVLNLHLQNAVAHGECAQSALVISFDAFDACAAIGLLPFAPLPRRLYGIRLHRIDASGRSFYTKFTSPQLTFGQ
jgi:hypothetical protein